LSALVLVVPELEAPLRAIRQAHDPAAKLGMPPHVTLLYPFASTKRLVGEARDGLAGLIAEHGSFDLSFVAVQRFPDVLWLSPEPAEPVLALAQALIAAYPAYPPYRGKFQTITPHLTVAQGRPDVLEAAERALESVLTEPVVSRIMSVELFTRQDGAWVQVDSFPLA
jgi:2'-5' RNA ligase